MPNKNGKTSRWLCPFKDYRPSDSGEIARLRLNSPYVFTKEWRDNEGFGSILRDFKLHGCTPSLCIRGKKWRFYVIHGTDMHEESDDLRAAFRKAFKKWEKAGRPNANYRALVLYVREHKHGEKVWKRLQWRAV